MRKWVRDRGKPMRGRDERERERGDRGTTTETNIKQERQRETESLTPRWKRLKFGL